MDIAEMNTRVEPVSGLLKAMAHPERLLVLCQLVDGEVGAGQLQSGSQLSQSAFSQHLAVLRKKNLVAVRKESQEVFYRLAEPRIVALIATLHELFCND